MPTDAFAGLEPAGFWRHFAALTRIPRPSHEEEQVVAHVLAWASTRGFASRRDDAGNLVVDVPATAGREGAGGDPPGPPRHGLRARAGEPVRPRRTGR